MKKIIRIAGIICFLFLQVQLFANTVIVKGYVKDSSNYAVANRTVKIYSTDSSTGGCLISHTKITNPNGYYIDTLTCNADIRKILIVVENCDGIKIIHEPVFYPNTIVESNFIICRPWATTPGTAPCKAAFSYTSLPGGVKFNGAGSYAPAGDSIISRTWTFGDTSATLTGNIVDPVHAYAKPGIYKVSLTIKTKNGCESKYYSEIVFTPQSNDCKVELQVSIEKLSPKKFRFNSPGITLVGDSIVQRIWKFGDGSSLDGNRIDPLKEYKDTGLYTVCVRVRTAKGCEKEYCMSVVVKDSIPGTIPIPTGCKAVFGYTIKDSLVVFNSSESRGSSPSDSIISRTWYYVDSTTSVSLGGNIITPSYPYTKPGKYTVYLVIKTQSGCESKYSGTVVIKPRPVPTNCKAIFTYAIKDSLVVFNSSESKGSSPSDSIISRLWSYRDSATSVSLPGNIITPSYPYTKPGTYVVKLVIKTQSGCESKFEGKVVIAPKPVPTGCKAVFTYSIKDSLVVFNSSESKGSTPSDSIISRLWSYRDSVTSVSLPGNVITPSYPYTKPGTYLVNLIIKTQSGCESRFEKKVVIEPKPVPVSCKAVFTYAIKDSLIIFNSAESRGSFPADSIISRIWSYKDDSTSVSLPGNIITPSYPYTKPGTYVVTLVTKSQSGCESRFEGKVVIAPKPAPTNCKASFSFSIQNNTVKFNSNVSEGTSATDSIIGRTWFFGDHTPALKGNIIDPLHTFAKAGTYHVYLYIKTQSGCESKYEATVVIAPVNCAVDVQFTAERISLKKIQFNSSQSTALQGDSIIERKWKFGDNRILGGNEISPVKEFPLLGIYNTCLEVKTINGCEAKACKQIVVQDTANTPQSSVDYVKIISINPNPVITRMMVTVYSRNNNVEAEITIYDIYGTGKLNIKKPLSQGNNMIEISAELLPHGPYFLKVSTKNGRDSKAFYKL